MCSVDDLTRLTAAHVVYEIATYVLAGVLVWHATHRERGLRWAATFFWGVLYGFVVEFLLITFGATYGYGRFLVMLPPGASSQVPLCVALGWGEILYVSTWTAQRLSLPWWLRPLAAAVLAVNIDLSLDPVAQQQCFWDWKKGGLYYDVPFDNFLGWFVIVALYSGAVRGGFRLAGRWVKDPHHNGWFSALLPCFAALVALGGLGLVEVATRAVNGSAGSGSEIGLFMVVFGLACTIAWFYALRSRRDHPRSWPILAVPLTFHVLSLGTFLFSEKYNAYPTLVVLIPLNLLVGAFAYAWISLDVLFPEAARATAARGDG